jgi:hypothetical protein
MDLKGCKNGRRQTTTEMLSCWVDEPRPMRKLHTTTRNSIVRSLQILDPGIPDNGNLDSWFKLASNKLEWNSLVEKLEPPNHVFLNFDDSAKPA